MANKPSWIPRFPARTGTRTLAFTDLPCDPDIARRMIAAIGRNGAVHRLGDVSDEATSARFFRFVDNDGASLFVKLIPASHAPWQTAANAVARFVLQAGVGASVILEGFPRSIDADTALCASPFVKGRHPTAEPAELFALGAAIARLHGALAVCPDGSAIRAAAVARKATLVARLEAVTSQTAGQCRIPYAVRALCARHLDRFLQSSPQDQVVHGDLNPGNILVDERGGVVFLDFEEAVVTWASPTIDLAFAIERLILLEIQDDAMALTCARALLAGHVQAGGQIGSSRDWLRESLRNLVMRSAAIMCEAEVKGMPWPASEWQKFANLAEMQTARADLIQAIGASRF
ncbi:MAG TPA: phosphotransferase [Kaistiaceae bacterium]|nr:phosphotransferase [Kaistiaceae bacterium]